MYEKKFYDTHSKAFNLEILHIAEKKKPNKLRKIFQ